MGKGKPRGGVTASTAEIILDAKTREVRGLIGDLDERIKLAKEVETRLGNLRIEIVDQASKLVSELLYEQLSQSLGKIDKALHERRDAWLEELREEVKVIGTAITKILVGMTASTLAEAITNSPIDLDSIIDRKWTQNGLPPTRK